MNVSLMVVEMTSSVSSVQQEVLAFLSEWWIAAAVVVSLLMQLLLLLTGGTRKWNRACRFVAWSAYNVSDYVATAALGGLAQAAVGSEKAVYAIWAPMLLLHLGAPDNIAAYAMEDAELWVRHCLTMLLQVATAVYVVADCARGWKYVVVSMFLTVVGSIKYAERTLALKCASRAAIVESALPIYKYMLLEPWISLPIKGGAPPSSPPVSAADHDHYYYIIRGEEKWHQNWLQQANSSSPQETQAAALRTPELVTLEDILSSQQLGQTPDIVFSCLGFALYKLYKRRIINLYMFEWREHKTKQLFLGNRIFKNAREIIFVIDVELSFLFDSLYTKAGGTAFSKTGVIFRAFTTMLLLLVSGIFILAANLDLHHQAAFLVKQGENITFLLLAAALVIEAYQLGRLALSNWARVWLACTYIIVSEKKYRPFLKALWLAALGKLIKLSNSFGRHKYWRNRIGQYAVVDALHPNFTLQSMIKYGKQAGLFHRDLLQLLPRYEETTQAVNDFKSYVLSKVLASCRGISSSEELSNLWWFLPKYPPSHQRNILYAASGFNPDDGQFYSDLEHLLMNWHVATCVCELLIETDSVVAGSNHGQQPAANTSADYGAQQGTLQVDLQMSKLLSRYLVYLLVHKAELLPCHADIGRQVAADTQRDLLTLTWNPQSILQLIQQDIDSNRNIPSNLEDGMKVGKLLQALSSTQERWQLIANVWVDILVFAAAANKPTEQLQQLILGGEFLTHLWLLLGHMGCGHQ